MSDQSGMMGPPDKSTSNRTTEKNWGISMSKFKVGDVCFLKGGSCPLTVIALVGTADQVEVMWFTDMNEGQRAVLHEAALMTEAELIAQNQQHDLLSANQSSLKRCQ